MESGSVNDISLVHSRTKLSNERTPNGKREGDPAQKTTQEQKWDWHERREFYLPIDVPKLSPAQLSRQRKVGSALRIPQKEPPHLLISVFWAFNKRQSPKKFHFQSVFPLKELDRKYELDEAEVRSEMLTALRLLSPKRANEQPNNSGTTGQVHRIRETRIVSGGGWIVRDTFGCFLPSVGIRSISLEVCGM